MKVFFFSSSIKERYVSRTKATEYLLLTYSEDKIKTGRSTVTTTAEFLPHRVCHTWGYKHVGRQLQYNVLNLIMWKQSATLSGILLEIINIELIGKVQR